MPILPRISACGRRRQFQTNRGSEPALRRKCPDTSDIRRRPDWCAGIFSAGRRLKTNHFPAARAAKMLRQGGGTGSPGGGAWAVAPFAAGFRMQGVALATLLWIGAGMKTGYDMLLWRSFRGLKPPEERG